MLRTTCLMNTDKTQDKCDTNDDTSNIKLIYDDVKSKCDFCNNDDPKPKCEFDNDDNPKPTCDFDDSKSKCDFDDSKSKCEFDNDDEQPRKDESQPTNKDKSPKNVLCGPNYSEYEEEHRTFYDFGQSPDGWLRFLYCPDSLDSSTKNLYEQSIDAALYKYGFDQYGSEYDPRRIKFVKIMGKFLDDSIEYDNYSVKITRKRHEKTYVGMVFMLLFK